MCLKSATGVRADERGASAVLLPVDSLWLLRVLDEWEWRVVMSTQTGDALVGGFGVL